MFIGTWAATTAPRSKAQQKAQQQVAAAPSAPSPTPTPGPQPQSVKNVFEAFDGEAADDPNVLGDDWNTINPTTNPAPGGANEDPPFGNALIRTFVYDPAIATDYIFTGGGTKDFNDLPSWANVQKGTGPDKDDVEHAFAAKYLDGITGNTVLVFGGDRPTSNGDANIGFWFFQKAVFVGPNGTFVDENGNPATHQDGDIFVLSAFTGGGGTSTIRVLKWISNANQCTAAGAFIDPAGNGSLCDITGTATAVGSGATNGPICANPGKCPASGNPDIGIPVVWPYANKDNKTDCTPTSLVPCRIPSPDFFEGGIDLTALGLAGECFSSFMLETRSAASVSAVLKDFALGKFESCSGTCNKSVNLGTVCEGQSSIFTYETTNTGGSTLGQTLKDVNDKGTPCTGPNTPAGCAADDTTEYITGGLSEVPAPPGVWTPTACTFGASPPATPISVASGKTLRCTRTVTLAAGKTYTDTLTVHTVAPFEGAVVDCVKAAAVTVVGKVTVAINVLTCSPPATGFTLTAKASGGTAPYTINFDGESCTGATCTGANNDELSIFRTTGGAYTATATDSSGLSNCGGTKTRNVGYCSDTDSP
jgi:hypothetical protein